MQLFRLKGNYIEDGGGGGARNRRTVTLPTIKSGGAVNRGGLPLRVISRANVLKIPVGGGGIPVQSTGRAPPPMVSGPATTSQGQSDTQVNRGPTMADTGPVWRKEANGRWTLIYQGRTTPNLTQSGVVTLAKELGIPLPPLTGAPSTNNQEKPMDLGNLLGDVIKTVGQYKIAELQQPVYQQPAFTGTLPGMVQDFFFDESTGETVVVAKKKPCKRRRRRRLATKSDIADLASLKTVLGQGEAFKMWIATHGR